MMMAVRDMTFEEFSIMCWVEYCKMLTFVKIKMSKKDRDEIECVIQQLYYEKVLK